MCAIHRYTLDGNLSYLVYMETSKDVYRFMKVESWIGTSLLLRIY